MNTFTEQVTEQVMEALDDRTIDERASHCFGCGIAYPEGLHLEFVVNAEELIATAPVLLSDRYQGAPGYIHGGIIATLMDEAMSKLNRPLSVLAMTRNLNVDYLKPSPIETPLTITGRHIRREGRKLFHAAELTDAEGNLLARATGLFIVLPASMLPPEFQPGSPQ